MLVLELHFSHLNYPGKVSSSLDRKKIEGLMTSRHRLLIPTKDLSLYSSRWKIHFCFRWRSISCFKRWERTQVHVVSLRKVFILTYL